MNEPLEVGLLIQPVNPWDWERYEAGAFDQTPDVADADVWDNIRHIALLAEPLGFDAFWITEHHRTPYGMSPNPLQVLAWLAGRTERIDLGAAVVVLPWHDPVRVAEDIAQLDNLAGNRRLAHRLRPRGGEERVRPLADRPVDRARAVRRRAWRSCGPRFPRKASAIPGRCSRFRKPASAPGRAIRNWSRISSAPSSANPRCGQLPRPGLACASTSPRTITSSAPTPSCSTASATSRACRRPGR